MKTFTPTASGRVQRFLEDIPAFDTLDDEPVEGVGDRHVHAEDYWRERT